MRLTRKRAGTAAALAAAATLVLAACGSGDIDDSASGGGSETDCGELNMAINPWVGYEASAYVVGQVAETQLDCTVNYKDLKEEVSWQGFSTGEVDVVIEDRRGRIVGVEVKASATVRAEDFRGLRQLQEAVGDRFVRGLVLHDHDRVTPFGEKLQAAPLSILWTM